VAKTTSGGDRDAPRRILRHGSRPPEASSDQCSLNWQAAPRFMPVKALPPTISAVWW